jgi:hypothetical protein
MLIFSSSVKSALAFNGGIRQRGKCRQTPNFLFNLAVQRRALFFEPFKCSLWICCGLTFANDRLSILFISSPSIRFKVGRLDFLIVCDTLLRRRNSQLEMPLRMKQRTRCGNSNNSCCTSIKSGVNLGVMGLRRKAERESLHDFSSTGNTHIPIDYNLSRRLYKRRTEACPIGACTAYATHSSGDAERSWPWEVRVTERRSSRDRRCRRQLWATRGESIIRTQDRVEQCVYICLC